MHDLKTLALEHAVHIDARHQLSKDTSPALFTWVDPTGAQQSVTLKGTDRTLMEKLCSTPIFSASRMKLSGYVNRLRDHNLPIHTFMYKDENTGGNYGVYCVTTPVRVVRAGVTHQSLTYTAPHGAHA